MQQTTANHAESSGITLWLSALPVEIAPLLALLEETTATCVAGLACWHGYLRGRRLYVVTCGVGGDACEQALAALLDRFPSARVLLVGTAGALNPSLENGDVVVASRAVSWPRQEQEFLTLAPVLGATGKAPGLTEKPHTASGRTFQAVSGSILSWREPVLDASLKARLREHSGADCVDMETGYVARTCAARGVPFLAIRGISDQANAETDELESADLAVAIWHATIVAVEALT
jgi:nucleoside phosphorylase